jgi:hypothetical protein
METLGRILFILVGTIAALLILPLLLLSWIGSDLGSAGVVDSGLACRSDACVREALAMAIAAMLMIMGTITALVLIILGGRRQLQLATLVALGYAAVGIIHTVAFGGLLWVPCIAAGLLALGAVIRLEGRSRPEPPVRTPADRP